MVRICLFVTAIAGAASVAHALPAPVPVASQKRAEIATEYKAQLISIATALQQLAENPSPPSPATSASGINKNAAYAGAAMGGAVGALIGGTLGAYMPANTTFNVDSILRGLTYEFNQVNSMTTAMKEDAGLGLLTKLIPKLGSLLAQQPNLGRGPKEQQGPYRPPPPPANMSWETSKAPGAEKPADVSIVPLPGGVMEIGMEKPGLLEGAAKPGTSVVPMPGGTMEMGMPKSAEGTKPAESKPQGAGMAGMEMAPPPTPGPPKPAPPTEPKAPSAPPSTGLSKDASSWAFPGLENAVAAAAPVAAPIAMSDSKAPNAPLVPVAPKDSSKSSFPGLGNTQPVAAPVAAPAVAPTITGLGGMGGHGHSGRRRR